MQHNNDSPPAYKGKLLAGCLLSAIAVVCWNMMPLILGSAADNFSLNDQQLGLLGSALLGGWLAATIPAYLYMHKINRKWVILVGAVLSSAGFLVSQFVNTVNHLYLSWSLGGLALPSFTV